MCFFVEIRTEDGGIGVHRQDGGKANFHGGLPQRVVAMVVPRCGRSKKMPCDRPYCSKCVHHGQEAFQLDAVGSTPDCLQHTNFLSESVV